MQENIIQFREFREKRMTNYNVAVVGATGAVGETLLSILEERNFPVDQIFALASERSAGSTVMFNGKPLMVTNLAEFDFSQAQIGLFSAGGSVSAEYAPRAGDAGCVVIDNTSHFRYDDDIPSSNPRGQSRGISAVREPQHHREPQLLNDPDASGAEADS